MNKGIKFASGKYIGFCNWGDLIVKNGIKIITKNLKMILMSYLQQSKDITWEKP